MRGAWAICKRELHSYFVSPVAYAVMATFWLVEGAIFISILDWAAHEGRRADLRIEQLGPDGNLFNVPAVVAGSFLETSSWLLLFVIPIVGMALLAQEKRRRTMELLLTSPVSNAGIMWGKFIGAYLFVLFVIAPTFFYQYLLQAFGANEPRVWITGYLGLALMAAAMLAATLFISSLTESQTVAAFGSYGLLLLFWFAGAPANLLPSVWRDAVRWLSLSEHFSGFRVGVIALRDMTYYGAFAIFFLFLTHMILESIRWRGVRGR
jgi:ABC-2 type transport system permease protein